MMQESIAKVQPIDDDEIDLLQLVRTIWSGKWLIALFATIAVTISVFAAITIPPTYRADALMQLEDRAGQMSLPTGLSDLVEDTPRSVTEMEIMRSRLVLGRAVAELHLDWVAEPRMAPLIGYALTKYNIPLPGIDALKPFARSNEQIRLDLLEVSPHWLGQPIVVEKLGEDSFSIELPNGVIETGVVGQTQSLPDIGFAIRVGELTGAIGREFIVTHLSEAAAISRLRGSLSVSERGRQSGILEVRLEANNRQDAQKVLDAVTRAYLRQNISRSAAEAESSLEFVEGQIPSAEAQVKAAETALNTYREEQKSVDMSFETQGLLSQISQLESQLTDLAIREEEISDRYTPNHPVYRQLLDNRQILEERLQTLRGEIGGLPRTQREVINLTRDLEMAQEAYIQLLSRAQELSVLKASNIGNVRIIDNAQSALNPIAPRKSLIVALGLMLGLIVGIAVVLLREMTKRGIRGSDEIEQLGIPVFATINHTDEENRGKRKNSWPILALTNPTDLAVEGFRSLRTSLHFGMLDAPSKAIAITSAAPEAGKSFSSVNLAIVAAQAGQKVCLIDADMRRGQLRKYFSVDKNTPGFAELLAGEVSVKDVQVDGPVDGLAFIPSGQYPPNPSELLMRNTLASLVEELDKSFDLILFDCPPVLAVTDPLVVSGAVGTTLVVLRHEETQAEEVMALQRSVEVAGHKISGAILNGYVSRNQHSSYSYNYRYAYENRRD